MRQDSPQMSLLRRHLSPLAQLIFVAFLALFVVVAIFVWPVIAKNTADQAERAQPPLSALLGTFRPTKEQWAGSKIEPVKLPSFLSEQVTEGSTALANVQTARSRLAQAQMNEKRAHELYLAQDGALKDWQQSQTDLVTAQNTVRSDEIALAAVRNRLRILGKSDKEIAALEAQPTQRLDPVTSVTAPIGGTISQRQI